ncbi:hypothetical protein [Sulfitobacter sp. EhC04]|uniref:hypothetical protein n=1 Tax=Sulfitobacter sp. EhC04 TaxID=1849168 RepID=UPI00191321DA|nr:hypothetical protein [Sulfitobacter sp. EhC04]
MTLQHRLHKFTEGLECPYPDNAAYILRNGAASLRGLNALDRIGTEGALAALSRKENMR